jgi:hypothetical protein
MKPRFTTAKRVRVFQWWRRTYGLECVVANVLTEAENGRLSDPAREIDSFIS